MEDNDLNMEIAEFFLQEMGARVVRAWNGKEAVDLFAASAPGEFELIMMDIMMPVMDGLEATAGDPRHEPAGCAESRDPRNDCQCFFR